MPASFTFGRTAVVHPHQTNNTSLTQSVLTLRILVELNLIEVQWDEVKRRAHELAAVLENEFIQLQPIAESASVIGAAKECLVSWRIIEEKGEESKRNSHGGFGK